MALTNARNQTSISSNSSTPWMEWNKADTSQFDTKVEGARVASSTVAVETVHGVPMVTIDMTTDGTAQNSASGAVVLPIMKAPPSANYLVECKMIEITSNKGNGFIGGLVGVRFTSLEAGYWFHWVGHGANGQLISKLASGPTDTPQFGHRTVETWTAGIGYEDRGLRAEIGVNGDILSSRFPFELQQADISSPHTAAGKAMIGVSGNGQTTSANKVGFWDIKCFAL